MVPSSLFVKGHETTSVAFVLLLALVAPSKKTGFFHGSVLSCSDHHLDARSPARRNAEGGSLKGRTSQNVVSVDSVIFVSRVTVAGVVMVSGYVVGGIGEGPSCARRRLEKCEQFLSSTVSVALLRSTMTRSLLDEPMVPRTWLDAMEVHATLEDAQRIASGTVPGWCPRDMREFVETGLEVSVSRVPQAGVVEKGELPKEVRIGLSAKKAHEVEALAATVAQLAAEAGVNRVVDIGSGKGYLAQALCLHHGLNVVGLEAQSTHNASTVDRVERIRSLRGNIVGGEMNAMTRFLSGSTVSDPALRDACNGAVIVALHACGDLTPIALRLFATTSAAAVVALSCCYHRVSSNHFPMSTCLKNEPRVLDPSIDGELACHAIEQWAKRETW